MNIRHAACSCGQLTAIVSGEPLRVSVCHCLACQRRTGSTYGSQARFPRDRVEIKGTSTRYLRTSDDGNGIVFHFCPGCGATVYYHADDMPESIVVPVGAFADPRFPAPTVSVYEARRHSWVSVPANAEHID